MHNALKCLFHHVVILCCGVVSIGLLNWLIARPGDPEPSTHPCFTHKTNFCLYNCVIVYWHVFIFKLVISWPDDVITCKGREAMLTVVLNLTNSNTRYTDLEWYKLTKSTNTIERMDPYEERINFIVPIGKTILQDMQEKCPFSCRSCKKTDISLARLANLARWSTTGNTSSSLNITTYVFIID